MTNVLEKIIADKKSNIENYKKYFSVENLKEKISSYKNYLNFKDKLKTNTISVIAEIKKASPSAGVIVKNYDPMNIAKQYLSSGASCLSVLTEENYFKGKLEHIEQIKKEVKLPILCKDFFIDPYQVYLAKSFGPMQALLIDAEYITKVNAICMICGDPANFSYRISSEKKQVVVGEADKYEARCRRCYYKNNERGSD